MTILGNVAGLGLAAALLSSITSSNLKQDIIHSHVAIFYLIAALVVLIGLLITLIGVHEVPLNPGANAIPQETEQVKHRFARWFKRNWVEPWRSYNFTVVFLTRSSIMMGLALFMTFIEYYFARVQHLTNFVQVTAVVA